MLCQEINRRETRNANILAHKMDGSLDETMSQLMTTEERGLLKNSFGRIKLKVCSFFLFLIEIYAIKIKIFSNNTNCEHSILTRILLSDRQFKRFTNPLSAKENDDASPSTEGLKGIDEMLDNYSTFKEYLDDVSRLVKVYSQRYRGKIEKFNCFGLN